MHNLPVNTEIKQAKMSAKCQHNMRLPAQLYVLAHCTLLTLTFNFLSENSRTGGSHQFWFSTLFSQPY